MGTLAQDIRIPAPPGKFWPIFADLRRLPDWLTMHVKFKSDVPLLEDYRVGMKVSEVISMMGMPNTIEWTLEEFEAGKSVRISGTGMAGVQVSFAFSVEPMGASVCTGHLEASFTGQMIVGALGKAIEKQGLKELKESLVQLADLLVVDDVISADQRADVEILDPAPAAS
jgi:hypothetical protein